MSWPDFITGLLWGLGIGALVIGWLERHHRKDWEALQKRVDAMQAFDAAHLKTCDDEACLICRGNQ